MNHLESKEQRAVIKWANLSLGKYPMLKWLHSSQAGVKMNTIQASIAKAEGMKSGISDIFLPYPICSDNGDGTHRMIYAGLYIEMKRPKVANVSKGVISQNQKDFLEYANKVGYKAVVCYGATEAIEAIKNYLEMDK